LKHVQNGLLCFRIRCAHDLFLLRHYIADCKRARPLAGLGRLARLAKITGSMTAPH
jgi:hypothetical protein